MTAIGIVRTTKPKCRGCGCEPVGAATYCQACRLLRQLYPGIDDKALAACGRKPDLTGQRGRNDR